MTPPTITGHEPAAPSSPHPRRWRLVAGAFLLGGLVIAIDQGTKVWAEAALTRGERIPLIGDLLGLQLAYNPGAAFSFGEGFTWVFAVVAAAATVAAIVFAFRVQRPAWAIVIGALGGAAASHAFDRLFREPGFARGHVVDFLAYGNWFIGNIADIVIVTAAIAGAFLMLREPPARHHDGATHEE
ncbi:Lipoprotein signal peptidase [Micrococcus luteus]|uniref:Lipoprotein signal peptidase n=1 Tax=Nesterenkonia massiliensis TaxID=1232429 RepID=A0ABT2HQI0_9MICC|nr:MULTISPECIES: signal peptidase II [Micrococcaceae]EZP32919.1 Lipoprotein signal peptidase [Micrococcus luteus]MCT1606952.1 signal peptidase II [Nesterenkonia massiliensis]MCV7696240.1 signal peptidase II [Micrococcus luteus]CVM38694.1 lipoprotein signal peptidase [Streptococcus pneumoniae]